MILHSTGPVYFKVMMENILASTPESMRGLTTIIQDTKLSDFDGENVTEFASFARGAIEQLRNNNALPTDVLSLVAQALKACETQDFVSYINVMYNNHVQSVKRCTIDDMLLLAETEYVSLVSAKKWKAKIVDHSAFFTGTCYTCGEKGHMNRDCPLKKDKSQGSRGGRGRGDGRGRGGRGGGRGRGGRGRIEKDKQPPKPGESHTRTKNGRTEKWCGVHGYWTWGDIAHETKDCTNRPTGNQTGNVAREGDNPPTSTQSSSEQPTGAAHTAMTSLVSHAVDF
jgi:Zinc knuckle